MGTTKDGPQHRTWTLCDLCPLWFALYSSVLHFVVLYNTCAVYYYYCSLLFYSTFSGDNLCAVYIISLLETNSSY